MPALVCQFWTESSAHTRIPSVPGINRELPLRVEAVQKLPRVFARTGFVRFCEALKRSESKKIAKNFALLDPLQIFAEFSHGLGREQPSLARILSDVSEARPLENLCS
jgi:hypothetical protein